ncbi:hypothetical protein JTB14_008031 [Gonioctena quinquepunctata]|nr:hypothetical protein JTB14_008031 [Gonioctena quinquepunctata]
MSPTREGKPITVITEAQIIHPTKSEDDNKNPKNWKKKNRIDIEQPQTDQENDILKKKGKHRKTENREDFTKMNFILREAKIQHHWYTSSEGEKTHAFVIRGLDSNPTTDEVKEEPKILHKMNELEVLKYKTEYRPLHMVTTPENMTLDDLKKSLMPQVSNVSTRNCLNLVRFLKCAHSHWTRDCKKPYEVTSKCANCDGDHLANNTGCEVYQKRIENIQERKESEKRPDKSLREVPIPEENAWKKIRAQDKCQDLSKSLPHPSHPPLTLSPRAPLEKVWRICRN